MNIPTLRDRPTDEDIEITEEMIAAGVAAYGMCDSRVDDVETVVQDIYEAMEKVRVKTRA